MNSLDGIGDVLVVETKRRSKNKVVLQGLKRIENIIKTLFNIQKDDPDKFERLILAQEYYELHAKDEKDARFRLAYNPEKYLISFSTAVNQILRVHEAATEVKNFEISKYAVYHLNQLLADISQTAKNDLIVEQLLKYLAGVSRVAIENQDKSMYLASINWYINIVFGRYRQKESRFDLSYLGLFDRSFFDSVKYIVSENQTLLFKSLISSLVDDISIPSYNKGKIWKYGHLILGSNFDKYNQLEKEHKIENRIKELVNSENYLDTKEKCKEWIDKFEEIKNVLIPNFSNEQHKKASEIEIEIREYIDAQFKYNNLLEIVFSIGTYCLFKQKPEYIKYFWEYKQPHDCDASWIGHDIVPNTIDEAVKLYFKKGLLGREINFWEGHHGTEKYKKEYFLLLLSRLLQHVIKNDEGRYIEIENYKLPDLHIHKLSDLENAVNDLVKVAVELKLQNDYLRALGFDVTTLEELFDNKVIPFLNGLKLKAQERIKFIQGNQNLSNTKICMFKDNVLKGYIENSSLIKLLNYYKLYEDKTNEIKEGKETKYGIFTVDVKGAFFDEWHVYYGNDWGTNYGSSLASSEKSFLYSKIANECEVINQSEFENILDRFDNISDILILITSGALHSFFERSNNFKSKWHKDVKQIKLDGFVGYYSYKENSIPVFETYYKELNDQILILNKSRFGTLVQYSPLYEGESLDLKKGNLFINVESLSENNDRMEEFIKKPPNWLKEKGDERIQRAYLQERVTIQISERFEYKKHEEFEGYVIKLKEVDNPI